MASAFGDSAEVIGSVQVLPQPSSTNTNHGSFSQEHRSTPTPDLPGNYNAVTIRVMDLQWKLQNIYLEHKLCLKRGALGALVLGYTIYVGFAVHHSFQKSVPLLVFTALGVVLCLYFVLIKPYVLPKLLQYWAEQCTAGTRRRATLVAW